MSNMSYCRFRNTASDLQDCIDAIEDMEYPESESEKAAAKRMRDLCKEYIEAFDSNEEKIMSASQEEE